MSLGRIHSLRLSGRSAASSGTLSIATDTEEHEWQLSDVLASAATRPVTYVAVHDFEQLDEDVWFAGTGRAPTLRELASEYGQVQAADLERPLLAVDGLGLLDGTHRIVRALVEGRSELPMVSLSLDELLGLPHSTRTRVHDDG
jgi:hypothetical protein